MKTTTRRMVALAAVGALGLGGLAAAAPALAGVDLLGRPAGAAAPGPGGPGGNGPGMPGGGPGMPGNGPGWRDGDGPGGPGRMAGDGTCLGPAATAEQGTLTEDQRNTLGAMAQEEKLAHDLYADFAGRYDAAIFDRIAAAELQHLAAVRTLLGRYELTDPTEGVPAGQFSDATVQATYDQLLARGRENLAAALQVGQDVEQADIDALGAALDGLNAPDVQRTYTHLRTASQHHLAAFEAWATR